MSFEELLKIVNRERYQKLTLEKLHWVWDIRARASLGENLSSIGKVHGLQKHMVSLIASGKRYGDVLTPEGMTYCSKAYKAIVAKRQGWNRRYTLESEIVNQKGLVIWTNRTRGVIKEDLRSEVYQIVKDRGFLNCRKFTTSTYLHTFMRKSQSEGFCTLTITLQEE